jgi:hypothetical protein
MEEALRRMPARVREEKRAATRGAEKSAAEIGGGGERLTASSVPSHPCGGAWRAICTATGDTENEHQ